MNNLASKFLLFLFFLSAGMTAGAATKPLLKTRVAQGKISGVLENGYAAYKGIPYAVPPVGELRWKSPVPAKPWKGTYKANAFKASPCQPHDPNQPKNAQKKRYSEDCLYLNVFTPATKVNEKLPVMVWIHGGGFITGSAAQVPADNYVKQGIVFVSIEYRLGALGFLALPELSAESKTGTSGNYGMQDQILALRWIHDNIAAFGGDPDKVTIFGESAGAISVSMLCASPEAKGLFRGAISQSGGSFCPVDSIRIDNNGIRDQRGAMDHGVDFMHRMGANNLAELRKMDADKLVNDKATTGVGGFWPCVDGQVIVDDQYKLYDKGQFNDVNIIVGTNSDEGTMFCRPMKVTDYQSLMRKTYGPWADRVLQLYPATTDEETFYALSDEFRETAFAWPSFAWANLQTRQGKSKVYMYYFDQMQHFNWAGPGLKIRGAGHASDLDYIFYPFFGAKDMTAGEKEQAKVMRQYWINFVKTGNPNGGDLPVWPLYNRDRRTVMHFKDDKIDIINVPNREKLEFWEDFYTWKRNNWKYRH
jgi:para-nitrobenzyl esterase